MRFDFTDLNLFRHIVEAGSITHGAERSNLALAAASTRVRKMELAFGTALLVRGRAGVTPTPAGRTLLQHARGILAQTERLQEDLEMPYYATGDILRAAVREGTELGQTAKGYTRVQASSIATTSRHAPSFAITTTRPLRAS